MTTGTLTITDFLRARLKEDEAVARAATGDRWEWWNLEGRDQGWSGQGPDLQTVTDEFEPCPYPGCTWNEGDPNHRGTPGRPGHSHRATERVISAWGHDAWGTVVEPQDAEHIARHDPARVLAECEAKRRIVELHDDCECDDVRYGPFVFDAEPQIEVGTTATGELSVRQSIGTQEWLGCDTLRALAAVYADHADYRPEWA